MWLGEGGSCCGILCHVMRCGAMSVVSCRARWCNVMSCNWMEWDGMWLCDAVIWEMMCCELWRTHVPAKPWRRPFPNAIPMRGQTLGCKTKEDCGEPMSQN